MLCRVIGRTCAQKSKVERKKCYVVVRLRCERCDVFRDDEKHIRIVCIMTSSQTFFLFIQKCIRITFWTVSMFLTSVQWLELNQNVACQEKSFEGAPKKILDSYYSTKIKKKKDYGSTWSIVGNPFIKRFKSKKFNWRRKSLTDKP